MFSGTVHSPELRVSMSII